MTSTYLDLPLRGLDEVLRARDEARPGVNRRRALLLAGDASPSVGKSRPLRGAGFTARKGTDR
jgi:hypothetical protein